MDAALGGKRPLRAALRRVFEIALQMYCPADAAARGCFLIGTAAVESVGDEDIRTVLREGLRSFDQAFEARLRRGQAEGELAAAADAAVLARVASALLHTLALRSRAGDARAELLATANAGIELICNVSG